MNKFVLGLTGGFGTGKSTVLSILAAKGAATFDADAIVHRLLQKKSVLERLRRRFGSEVFSEKNQLDRSQLAARIFSSQRERQALERILHPLVRKQMFLGIKKAQKKVVVCDIPLLFERKWVNYFDAICVVATKKSTQLARLKKKGFATLDIRKRLASQWPLAKKVTRADYVINNNGSLSQTKKQVDLMWTELRKNFS